MSSFFKWGGRKDESPSASPVAAAIEPLTHSKVLPKVLATLSHVQSPTLMDLGPVVGSNISFFGEQLGCKILVEDLYAVVESHAKAGTRDALPAALVARLTRGAGSMDGIFCWDLFDYLDRPSSQALASHLVALLRPGGVLYGFFGSTPADLTHYTRFTVETTDAMRLRQTPATSTRRNVLVTRDINKMFDGLVTKESVLLKSNAREVLFRKPS
ncbi:MAG: hypothetical protein ABI634_11925 [Acidobacteriota bacterium]